MGSLTPFSVVRYTYGKADADEATCFIPEAHPDLDLVRGVHAYDLEQRDYAPYYDISPTVWELSVMRAAMARTLTREHQLVPSFNLTQVMAAQDTPRMLWKHSDPESTYMGRFRRALEQHVGKQFKGYHDLYDFSITQPVTFWDFCWKNFNLLHEGSYTTVVNQSARMDSIPHWFTGVRLNFAENLLFSASPNGPCTRGKEDAKIAVVEVRESLFDPPPCL
ncbi:hypothetical protein AWENTII_007727 [Aspergillus wentii]